ncbi:MULTISPECIES: MipA/OmpV family protein [unclassified Acidovorax]|uniref:MipA/OmpV family protein n=1 Tax=unclassified Acidovorax TaxID=2684926 RepID=UPI001C450460|nr:MULTISPECIES: MipA/OmpV family protein [unclassified Acidovorax]MBV7427943.1 MipA/OmpV family protein [Acidovorax sp. sif0732]MBV7449200.1 MipA/OmpV family protein [Acidovorax sp. sif0715]
MTHCLRLPSPTHHTLPGRAAVIAATLAALAPAAAWAQQDAPTSTWGAGLAVSADRKPYRDFDDKAQPLPLLTYENRWVHIAGPGVDVKLPPAGPVGLRLRSRFGFEGYEAKDSPFLTGMQERKGSLWLGAAASWDTGPLQLSAELLADASGHSKGRQFTLKAERRFQLGAWDITPRVSVQRQDRKYVDYYYGVEGAEARAGRPAHEGSSAVNLQAGLRVGYALAPRQWMFVDVSSTRLASAIKNSPLVNRSSQPAVTAGWLYRF